MRRLFRHAQILTTCRRHRPAATAAVRSVLLMGLVCLSLGTLPEAQAGKIIKCLDANGGTVFTFHKRDCAPEDPVDLSAEASQSTPGVNFRQPARSYQLVRDRWEFRSEKSLALEARQANTLAINQLKRALNKVFDALPRAAAVELTDVRFVLLHGPASPHGGLDVPFSYVSSDQVTQDDHLDPNWSHSIVVYNAGRLLLTDDDSLRRQLVRELARAWQATHWAGEHPPIADSWQQARQRGLYRDMPTRSGNLLERAPPLQSSDDYFAELSQLYFAGTDYAPFDRTALAEYDPEGYAMIEMLWQR